MGWWNGYSIDHRSIFRADFSRVTGVECHLIFVSHHRPYAVNVLRSAGEEHGHLFGGMSDVD